LSQITLTIASRLDAVPLLGQLVAYLCLRAGLNALDTNGIEVCLVEAVNNSIKHAYGGDGGHTVAVDVRLQADELTLDIWDRGKAADPEWIHRDHSEAFDLDPDRPEDFSESGRGLAIIQQVMDSFEYTPGIERNRFRLTKRLKGE
jgi:serine/threonine-protein kinase RsbW